MVGIDPQNIAIAGRQLRQGVEQLDDVGFDITAALTQSGLYSSVLRFTRAAELEYSVLDSILRTRASLASGHTLSLIGQLRAETSALWNHLLDPSGADAALLADQALLLLANGFGEGDANMDGQLDYDELTQLATAGKDRAVQLAAQYLLDHPLYYGLILTDQAAFDAQQLEPLPAGELLDWAPADGLRLESIERFLQVNEEIRERIAGLATSSASGLSTPSPSTSTPFTNEWDPTTEELFVTAINRHAFVDDPFAAREFIASLPSAALGQSTLPIADIQGEAVAALHLTVLKGVVESDLATRSEIVASLPESVDGYRNQQITRLYAITGLQVNQMVNLDLPVGDPDFAGANWALIGAAASFSVGPTIRGELSSYGIQVPGVISQSFADGNQVIFASVMPHYVRLLETFADGNPTPNQIEEFLNGFADGEDELRYGFAAQIAVMLNDNPDERQRLQFVSNLGITVHEQAIVDPYLDMGRLDWWQQAGAHVASGFAAGVQQPFSVPSSFGELVDAVNPLPFGVTTATRKDRTAGQIATDDGVFAIPFGRDPDGNIIGTEIRLGDPLPTAPIAIEALADVDLSGPANPIDWTLDDLGLPIAIEYLPTIDSVLLDTDFTADYEDWVKADPNILAVDDWTTFEDRMKFTFELLRNNQSNPDLLTAATFIASDHAPGQLPGRVFGQKPTQQVDSRSSNSFERDED